MYYNPNIYPPQEYHRREAELERFVKEAGYHYPVIELPYDPQEFIHRRQGDWKMSRRRAHAARSAIGCGWNRPPAMPPTHGFDWYCTTLSISPMKRPHPPERLGTELGRQYGVPFLPSEFRKKDGYKRSLQLSAEYGLYRQDYCGCVFSKKKKLLKPSPWGNCRAG